MEKGIGGTRVNFSRPVRQNQGIESRAERWIGAGAKTIGERKNIKGLRGG